MDSALLSFFTQDKDLVTDNRPLRLRLAHSSQMLEDVLLPQHVHGTESICGSLEYRILCVSLDAFIPLKELIALPVAVDIVTDRGDLRSICGIVTEARAGDSDGGLASYQLVMRDALSIMEKRTNTRVFRNRNEVEIVQVILDEWRTTNPIVGTCFSYEMDDLFGHRKYPQREFTMQYNESDAAFIRRLLKRRGIAWYFRADRGRSPSHTMVLFNHPGSLPPNAAGVVRYHRDASTEERDTITSWCAVRTLQPASVARFSWDYKNPRNSSSMFTTAQGRTDQGETGNELAASLDDYQILSPHAGDNYDDLCHLGQLAMNRHDFESKCFHGEGSVRDLCVGEYFTMEGHPEIDGHPRSECEFSITSMQLIITNNLSKDLAERVFRLFSRNRWQFGTAQESTDRSRYNTRIQVSFTVVRRGIAIVPAFDAQSETPNIPMQSAMVVGPGDEEIYCDELGRVKVRFRTTRPADHKHAQGAGAADNDVDSAWIRVASNWAGEGPGRISQCGSLTLPRVGSEVLISFLGGDADKPVIVGQLFNIRGQPPTISGVGALPGNRYISGIRSRENHGVGANCLQFDDTAGEISTSLTSDHAASQINLGFLTQPRVGGMGKPRGEGAELVSRAHVAIRAAKGVLLTAYPPSNPPDRQLERTMLLQLIGECEELSRSLSSFASQQKALKQDARPLQEFRAAVDKWEEGTNTSDGSGGDSGRAVIGIAAPGGIGLAAESELMFFAGANVDQVAQLNLHQTAGQSCIVNAGKGISLFTHSDGLKAIANKGRVQIQSQSDATDVNAAKDLTLTSSEGKLVGMAKEIVLIAEDGSFIKIGSGITIGTSGTINYHAAKHPFKGGKTMSAALPKFTCGETNVHVATAYEKGTTREAPAPDKAVKIEHENGTVVESRSDKSGKTPSMTSDQMHRILVSPIAKPED